MSVLDSLRPRADLRVLVTAGAGGIGAAIVRAFAECGARVHACDIDAGALGRLADEVPGTTVTPCDVASADDVDRVFADAADALGGELDVLVNNAGAAGPTGPIESIEPADWARTVAVNLDGQYLFARRAVPLLKRSASGPCVLAISSVAGRLGYPLRSPYAATKWAVVGLAKTLAVELGPHGVRANAILPGPVEGERMERVFAARAAAEGSSVEAVRADYVGMSSLRRMVTVEDVAATALFLASPAARNVTGQAISVDANVERL